MKQYLRVAFILFAICAVSSLALALINDITAPVIKINIQKETDEALSAVSAGLKLGIKHESSENGINYYIDLLDENGNVKGYITELSGSGYGGAFTLVASYDTNGTLLDAKMMGNSETPGLGKKSEESWYIQMFKGKGGAVPLPLKKTDLKSEQADAVSGATVTFTGVTKSLSAGSSFVKTLGGTK